RSPVNGTSRDSARARPRSTSSSQTATSSVSGCFWASRAYSSAWTCQADRAAIRNGADTVPHVPGSGERRARRTYGRADGVNQPTDFSASRTLSERIFRIDLSVLSCGACGPAQGGGSARAVCTPAWAPAAAPASAPAAPLRGARPGVMKVCSANTAAPPPPGRGWHGESATALSDPQLLARLDHALSL